MRTEFRQELESLLNTHSMEGGSDTPDFILAQYLDECLKAFDIATALRDQWYRNRGMHERPRELAVSQDS